MIRILHRRQIKSKRKMEMELVARGFSRKLVHNKGD